jgi:RNA polymerase sigma-70 factor (ECF subfamily)
MTALVQAFLDAAPPSAVGAFRAQPGLASELPKMVADARAAWPQLDADALSFVSHVASTVFADTVLSSLHAGDLYLAFCCALGDPAALEAFDQHALSRVNAALRGQLPQGATVDEVTQRLRLKLFVRTSDAAPAIWSYSGKGPLIHWLRAAAVRVVQDLARRGGVAVSSDEALADTPALVSDPDLELLKGRFASDFKAAFQEALSSLSAKEQNLLRLQVIDGLSPDEIGRVYSAHRATVWRWLSACREALRQKTRELLAARVQANESELSSLMNAVHSQLDVSLNRVLRKP